MRDQRLALHPRGRLLAVLVLLAAFFVIAPPQTALADTTFSLTTPSSNGNFPANVAVGDLNGDGILDFAIPDQLSAYIAILLGNGDGTFHNGTSVSFPLVNFAYLADVNGDGKLDLINLTSQVSGGNVTKINARLGNGDGTFSGTTKTTTSPFFTTSAAFADLNGDGIPDALLTDPFNNQARVLKGVGDGTFTASTIVPSGGANPYAAFLIDLDSDQRRDIVLGNSVGGNVAVFRNTGNDGSGNPQFSPAVGSPYAVGGSPTAISAGFLTGGANPDLVVAQTPATNPTTTPGSLTTLLNNGAGGFTVGTSVPIGVLPGGVTVASLTGSGKADAVVFNYPAMPGGLGSASVYAGNGDGTFVATPVATIPTGHGPKSLAVGDFNRDGKPDVVVTNADDNTLTVAKNTTTPFPHLKPSLFDIFPPRGLRSGGTTLTIKGAGFQPGAAVRLITGGPTQGLNGLNVVISPDGTTITCTTPNFTGTTVPIVGIEVVNPDGGTTRDNPDIGQANIYRLIDPPAPLPPPPPANPPIPNVKPVTIPSRDLEVACNVTPCTPTLLPVKRPESG